MLVTDEFALRRSRVTVVQSPESGIEPELPANGSRPVDHTGAEFGVAVQQQESVGGHVRPGFSQLLPDPKRVGITSHVEMENFAAIMSDYEKAIQDTEGERRDGEEIHGRNGFAMIPQEGQPALSPLRVPNRSERGTSKSLIPRSREVLRRHRTGFAERVLLTRCSESRLKGAVTIKNGTVVEPKAFDFMYTRNQ